MVILVMSPPELKLRHLCGCSLVLCMPPGGLETGIEDLLDQDLHRDVFEAGMGGS